MRPLASYISNDLKKHTQEERFFNTVLSRILPSPLNQHVWASGCEQSVLKLHTDSPVWATRLRYHQHEIIKQLNSDPAIKLSKLVITISSRSAPQVRQKPKRSKLSASAKKSITQSAATVSDPEIRQLFEKLASR